MRFINRKSVAVAAIAVGTAGIGGGAFAYFTANGSGGGSASVGAASPIQLAASVGGTLYPGGSAQPVTITVTNPGSGHQYVDTVSLASISTPAAGCDVSNSGLNPAFSMADVPVGQNLAPGASTTVSGSLQMNDTGVNQNSCQNAGLTLNLVSN